VGHDKTVTFVAERLDSGDLGSGWSAQVDGEGIVTVSGPCPVCHGDAYGPVLPSLQAAGAEESLLVVGRPPSQPDERLRRVRAECCCGSKHKGDEDASGGCGRWWYVNVRL
jgi:hypothetical protein